MRVLLRIARGCAGDACFAALEQSWMSRLSSGEVFQTGRTMLSTETFAP